MEELSAQMANSFQLTSKVDMVVEAGEGSPNHQGDTVRTFDLVGRVVSEKSYSGHTLLSNVERLLRPVMGFQFQSFGENRFLLQFNHALDRTHAMEGSPWLLDRCAMLLSLVSQDANPETMALNLMTIVVRLMNIPLGYRNPMIARRLCASLGYVVEVIPPKGDGPQVYIRVKVQIDILEPILRGVHLRIGNGTRQWVAFVYERMPVYCYLCGVIGHLERSVEFASERVSSIRGLISRMANGLRRRCRVHVRMNITREGQQNRLRQTGREGSQLLGVIILSSISTVEVEETCHYDIIRTRKMFLPRSAWFLVRLKEIVQQEWTGEL